MKKILIPVLLLAICLTGIFVQLREPAGDTLESREEILRMLPKGIQWSISSEIQIDDTIVSSIYSANQDGLAVFAPKGNGKYECRSTSYRDKGKIVTEEIFTIGGIYRACWLNRANLDYAEIIFDAPGESGEPIRLDAGDMQIVYTRAPGGNYTMHVSYRTTDGAIIE